MNGEFNYKSRYHHRLSAELAELIRFEYENDKTTNPVTLAIKYNTSYDSIRDVLSGKTYNKSGKIVPIKRHFSTEMSYKGSVCIEDIRTGKQLTFKNYECALIFLKATYPDISGNISQLKMIKRKLMTYREYRDYKFVPVENGGRVPRMLDQGYHYLSKDDVKKIRDLYFNDGWCVKQIVKKYGVSHSSIEHILKGKIHRDVGGKTSNILALNGRGRKNKSLKGVSLLATNIKTGEDLYFNDIREASDVFLKFANTENKTYVYTTIYQAIHGRNKSAYGYTWQKL